MDPDSDQEPAIYDIDFQDANKKILIKKAFLLVTYFLKVHLHHFSRMKSRKKSQTSRYQGFSYYFCLMIEGYRSKPMINGFGSGRPKNMWIQWIRITKKITGVPKRSLFKGISGNCACLNPFSLPWLFSWGGRALV